MTKKAIQSMTAGKTDKWAEMQQPICQKEWYKQKSVGYMMQQKLIKTGIQKFSRKCKIIPTISAHWLTGSTKTQM